MDRVTLAAYRKFLLVAVGSGIGYVLLERASTLDNVSVGTASGYAGNVLLIEVADPHDGCTRTRVLGMLEANAPVASL